MQRKTMQNFLKSFHSAYRCTCTSKTIFTNLKIIDFVQVFLSALINRKSYIQSLTILPLGLKVFNCMISLNIREENSLLFTNSSFTFPIHSTAAVVSKISTCVIHIGCFINGLVNVDGMCHHIKISGNLNLMCLFV